MALRDMAPVTSEVIPLCLLHSSRLAGLRVCWGVFSVLVLVVGVPSAYDILAPIISVDHALIAKIGRAHV